MFRIAFPALMLLSLVAAACAPTQSIEMTAEEIERGRLEITGEPTPVPTLPPLELPPFSDPDLDPDLGSAPPAELGMTDELGRMCEQPGPVEGAQPYSWSPGIHPIWVVDLFSDPTGTGPQPLWMPPQWSASDASVVEMVACISVVPIGTAITCGANSVVGSFIAVELYATASGISLGRFSTDTQPQCATFDDTLYIAVTVAGDQMVADPGPIVEWLRPIVEIP